MEKIATCLLSGLMIFGLRWCNKEPKADFRITTEFKFARDGDKKEMFDSDTFKINTRIYVCVDFSITKFVENEEVISFVVQIPYAEYYSTKDYYAGTIKPKEQQYIYQEESGKQYTMTELTQMNFAIADKNTHDFHYIFEIEANQECEDAKFITRFKPENTNLNHVFVNGQLTNKTEVSYNFVAKER